MDYLVLIDSINKIPEHYSPRLIKTENVYLEEKASKAYNEMKNNAEKEKIRFKLLSGYRSISYQQSLWDKEISNALYSGLTKTEAENIVTRYLAKPQHSEHHTGLACDICSINSNDTQMDFDSLPEGRWLLNNAYKFGFILRYPRMKEEITGIAYEPWHFRYVGINHSEIIKETGLTLEEYLYYYRR